MPELIYPTRAKIRGPILINAAALKELDGILAEQMQLLHDLREKMVEEELAERIAAAHARGVVNPNPQQIQHYKDLAQISVGKESMRLVLYFSNGSQLKAKSFQEAAAHAETSQNLATSFDLEMQCGTISLRLSAESDSFSTELTVEVSPSGSEVAKNLFSAVRRWQRAIQAPRWQQWWCVGGHFRFVIWIIFLWAVLMAVGTSLGSLDENYYKQQGQQLVKQGVTPDKQQKAIETLLALQSGSPAPIEHRVGNRFWFFCIGGTIVCLILSYPPKLVLGLGVGEDRIGYWRAWTRFVFVVVPTFVASNFLWPYVSDVVKRLAAR